MCAAIVAQRIDTSGACEDDGSTEPAADSKAMSCLVATMSSIGTCSWSEAYKMVSHKKAFG